MRFLRLGEAGEVILTDDLSHDVPPYAILSHTWGKISDEITFQDINAKKYEHKFGYRKILFCGEQARRDNLEYFWIDTCCIDKKSSAELSEAINSMYRWYENAQKCYVYFSDVSVNGNGDAGPQCSRWQDQFRNSRWFTR
jgi:hypothetical protein